MSDSTTRFAFGENWCRFLNNVTDAVIVEAERSLCQRLAVTHLRGKRFLDIGSGSGLFSLAARRLGARVHSFDYDPTSVACTLELRRRYFDDDSGWTVDQASALDESYLQTLGQFDVVYSWGVLHHTGDMWRGLKNVIPLVAPGGLLFVAIYNDLEWISDVWRIIKRTYCRLPSQLRFLVLLPCAARLWGPSIIRDFLMLRPFRSWREYRMNRGMSPWCDIVDWVGGYPYEVARPEKIFEFYLSRGFQLLQLKTCGRGHGCNEFVVTKTPVARLPDHDGQRAIMAATE